MSRAGCWALALSVLLPGLAVAQDDEDAFTFGAMEVEVKSTERDAYETAVDKTKADRCEDALLEFWDLLQNPKAKEFHQGSEYYVAKCLYRLGLYHSALNRFAAILEHGEKNPYFQTSREWLFFISRKLKDQEAVLDTIAKYSTVGGVPEKYADEFHYLLAKHYYLMGIGDLMPAADEGRASESEQKAREEAAEDDEEFDFSGDGGDMPGPGEIPFLGSGGDDWDFSDDSKAKKPKRKKPARSKKPRAGQAKPAADDDAATEVEDDGTGFDFSGVDKVGSESPEPKKMKAVRRKDALPPGEAMERALQHLEKVPPGTKFHAKSRYLQGLVHFQREEFEKAVQAFRDVVRLTHPKTGSSRSPRLREQAFFSLARIHYGFKQFRYAIFYYDKISRDSEAWLDALFEAAWAYFRIGNFEKSLGNLITLHSPFFQEEYFPESMILKAVTYYENCRYPEARGILDEFEQNYGGVRKELVRISKEASTPEEYYKLLEEFAAAEPTETNRLTTKLVRLALSDQGLKALDLAVREIDEEEGRFEVVVPGLGSSALGEELHKAMTARRAAVVRRAGTILSEKLSSERDDLRSLASQLNRIKFEIAGKERDQIEAEMRGESLVVPLTDYLFSAAVDEEHEYYPFVGEYWRDELGTYEYTMTKGCRPESTE